MLGVFSKVCQEIVGVLLLSCERVVGCDVVGGLLDRYWGGEGDVGGTGASKERLVTALVVLGNIGKALVMQQGEMTVCGWVYWGKEVQR